MVKVIRNLILFWVVMSSNLCAQDFELLSTVNQSKIYKNEKLVLTLTVKGATKDVFKSIELPNFQKDFTIISSSQSSSFSFINGIANRTREYRYVLIPIESGIFIIDPFKIKYGGKPYRTKPLKVVVRDGTITVPQTKNTSVIQRNTQPLNQNKSKSIFLETKISTNNIFLGESIQYSVQLYRRISLWSSISINQDDLIGVWQNSFEIEPERVVRKFGQRYYELELINKEIRPLNQGELTIPPLTARFVVDPFSGEYQLQSEIVTINVNPLPEPKPASFSGAIGNYFMTALVPEQPSKSSTLQIQLIIEGEGNLAAISPPVIQDTTEYRVLSAPKNTKEELINKQLFDYVIIPKVSGEITIPPIEFSFFSKEIMDYITLKSGDFIFSVSLDDVVLESQNSNFNEDIQFLKENTLMSKIKANLLNKGALFFIILINSLILVSLIISSVKSKLNFSQDNPTKKRRRLIRKIHNLNQDASINEMQNILIQVLLYFTNYKQQAIHPKSVEQSLIKAELSDPLVKSTMQWIKNTQILQFAKEKNIDQNHSSSESLKRILKGIVKEIEA